VRPVNAPPLNGAHTKEIEMTFFNRTALWLVIGIVAAAVAGAAFAAPQTDAKPAGKRTIELREASATPKLTVIDAGDKGLSPGDLVVTTDGLLDRNGAAAGSMTQVCTLVTRGANLFVSTFDCTGTFDLAGGSLTIQGTFVPAVQRNTQAVTGGTGAFAKSRGEVVSAAEADTFTIELQ